MTDSNEYLALPESGNGPGVLVLHAWWGLNAFIKDVCNRLATEGYVVFAPDLYDGATASTREEAEQLASPLFDNFDSTSSSVQNAVEKLRTHPAVTKPQIGVVGFSLGAFWALEMAINQMPQHFAGTVVYYGNRPGIEPQKFAETQSKFLGHFAEEDEFEPFDEVLQTQQQLQRVEKIVTFHQYPDTTHWFAESDRPDAYDAKTAELAWTRTVEFLNQVLKS